MKLALFFQSHYFGLCRRFQNAMRTDDISDLSLSADLATGYGWSIGLFGHNLTDEDGATQFSPYDGESFVRLYPRRIGLKVGVDF